MVGGTLACTSMECKSRNAENQQHSARPVNAVPNKRWDELPRVEFWPTNARLDRLAWDVLHERRRKSVVQLEIGLVVEEFEGLEVLARLDVVRDDAFKVLDQRRKEGEVLHVPVRRDEIVPVVVCQ